jgi:hypothetical protein
MKFAITIFIIITAGLSFIASIGQLLVKERRLMNYNLFALLLCFAVLQLQAVALITGIGFTYPILFFLNTTALYLLGVIRYFAYFLVSLRGEDMPRKKFLYFMPSCFALLFDLYYLTLPEADKMHMITSLFSGASFEQGLYLKLMLAGAGIQATVYWSMLLVKLIKSRKAGKAVVLSRISIAYNVLSIIAMCILSAGYLLTLIDLFITASIMLGLMIIGTFLIHQMSPEFLQITIFPKTKKRYSRSLLTRIETDGLYRQLMELIEVEKVYADENVSLTDCADELSITPHQLSEFLN